MNEIQSAAATLGALGGKSTSPAKQQAARENGRKGGRPEKSTASPDQSKPWILRTYYVDGGSGERYFRAKSEAEAARESAPGEILRQEIGLAPA